MNKRQRKKHGGASRRRRRVLLLTQRGWWDEIGAAVRNPVSQGLLRSAVTCFLKNCIWPPVTDLKMARLVREVGAEIVLDGERLRLHKVDCDREHLMLIRTPTRRRLAELRRRLDDIALRQTRRDREARDANDG